MRLLFLCMAATAWAATVPLRAADLVTYDFENDLSATTQGGVTATGFLGNGSNAVVGLNPGEGYGYILIKEQSTSASSAVSNRQFATFTVSPPPQNGMQIDSIRFSAARGGDSTPRGVVLRWSFDNYSSNLGQVNITSTWPKTNNYSIPLNAFAGSPVTFRLYAFASQPSGAQPSIRFDNLKISGTSINYLPTVTPAATRITTRQERYGVRGTAFDSSGIARVEWRRNSPNGNVWNVANGLQKWNFIAGDLRRGSNVFYVRSVDRTGQVSEPVRIVIRRTTSGPKPSPTP